MGHGRHPVRTARWQYVLHAFVIFYILTLVQIPHGMSPRTVALNFADIFLERYLMKHRGPTLAYLLSVRHRILFRDGE